MKKIQKFIKDLVNGLNTILVEFGGDCKTFHGKPVKFCDNKIENVVAQAIAIITTSYYSGTSIPFSIKTHSLFNWVLLFNYQNKECVTKRLNEFIESIKSGFANEFPKGKIIFESSAFVEQNKSLMVKFNLQIKFDDEFCWSK